MKCPKCEVTELAMTDRSGVEIDYCNACRGVWLDRGELDKIIERSAMSSQNPGNYSDQSTLGSDFRRDRDDEDDNDRGNGPRSRKGKKGFLGDIFDF